MSSDINDLDPAVMAQVDAAMEKMREGLQDFLEAISDEGEPEVADTTFVLCEAKGMNQDGIFARRFWLPLHRNATSTMVGVFDLLAEEIHHDLRCRAETHG